MQNEQNKALIPGDARPVDSESDSVRHKFFPACGVIRLSVVLALIVLLVAGAIVWINALPPKKVHLAAGPAGSSLRLLSEKFRTVFARHGIELVLVDTQEPNQGSQPGSGNKPQINAGFLIAGSASSGDVPGMLSLGSVQYAPFWLFYRGDAFAGGDPLRALATKRVAIGFEGTSARNILVKLQSLAEVSFARKDNLFELTHQDAVERFIAGAINAVFIVDGVDAPTIQRLIAAPQVQLYAFNLVDAYASNLSFLSRIDIPRGALNVRNIFPPTATAMLSSSVMLMVDKDMHPAIQWLFIMAAREIGQQSNQIIAKPGYFPAHLDQTVPLSPAAQRYYDLGRLPLAFELLPWQLASLDRTAWLAVPAAIVLLLLLNLLATLCACPRRTALAPAAAQPAPPAVNTRAPSGNLPAPGAKSRGARK